MRTVEFKIGTTTAKLVADGDRICQSVLSGKPFETKTLAMWASWCGHGGVVLDIGAYTGLFSIVARLRGAQAIAFEPMPQNRERFQMNCSRNGISRKVNSEAVCDEVGLRVLHYNPIPFTSGASLVRRTGAALTVSTVTVDSLHLQRLDAVKIDVERGEAAVLRGAYDTLRRLHPKLIVEVLDDVRADEVRACLLPLDYRRTAVLDERNWIMEHSA